jgi:predicted membrane protein
MKTASRVIWGVILICAGVIFGLNALGVTDIDVFFDGWWTLFIIIPCGVGLFTERHKTGNIMGLLIGVGLLLWCRDILDLSLLWKLILPILIVLLGIKLIFGEFIGKKVREKISKEEAEHISNMEKEGFSACHCATFSGEDANYDGQTFEGAELVATFGGVKCDLRNAVIPHDCAIRVSATFGGITILVPANVNVKVQTTSLFGGVTNKASANIYNGITIYVSGSCMFGGVDIK